MYLPQYVKNHNKKYLKMYNYWHANEDCWGNDDNDEEKIKVMLMILYVMTSIIVMMMIMIVMIALIVEVVMMIFNVWMLIKMIIELPTIIMMIMELTT